MSMPCSLTRPTSIACSEKAGRRGFSRSTSDTASRTLSTFRRNRVQVSPPRCRRPTAKEEPKNPDRSPGLQYSRGRNGFSRSTSDTADVCQISKMKKCAICGVFALQHEHACFFLTGHPSYSSSIISSQRLTAYLQKSSSYLQKLNTCLVFRNDHHHIFRSHHLEPHHQVLCRLVTDLALVLILDRRLPHGSHHRTVHVEQMLQ